MNDLPQQTRAKLFELFEMVCDDMKNDLDCGRLFNSRVVASRKYLDKDLIEKAKHMTSGDEKDRSGVAYRFLESIQASSDGLNNKYVEEALIKYINEEENWELLDPIVQYNKIYNFIFKGWIL